MIELFWNNWLLVGLLPPLLCAVVALIDACMVDSEVYLDPAEATIVSCLFGAIFLLLPIFNVVDFTMPASDVAAVAFVSGILFSLHIFFYMAGLFKRNDTVVAETMQNMSVLLVPFFAFFLLGEVLDPSHYVGIGCAGVGVVYMYFYALGKEKSRCRDFIANGSASLFTAMLLFCLVLISGEWVYERTDFWSGYLLFTAGLLFGGAIFFLFSGKKSVVGLMRSRWRLFLLIEGISTVAMVCSLRAVDISPSVTYVAITECLGAYFVMLLSGSIFFLHKKLGLDLRVLTRVSKEQLIGYPQKMLAGALISSSIFLIVSN